MNIFKTALASLVLSAGLVIASGVSVVSAQSTQATLTTKLDEGQIVEAGQVLVIPFYLNTNSVSVDGVQVTGRFTGVPVSEVRLEMAGELKAQALSQEVTNEGFSVMMSSADPSLPLVSSADALLFELTVVPAQAGEFRIEYDNENTLVPGSADSANVLTTPEPVSIAVGQDGMGGGVAPQSSVGNAVIALIGAGVLVGAGLFFMRRQATKGTVTSSTTTTTPPTSQV